MYSDKEYRIRLDELTNNSSARLPICLALDTSYSMVGDKLDELNAAVRWFFQAIRDDEMAAMAAEICVVSFGGAVKKCTEMTGIDRQQLPMLTASGNTPMGEAVTFCLETLDQQKRIFGRLGTDYFQPWLVLMTDGGPSDSIVAAVERCQKDLGSKKLTVIPIAIGPDADMATLAKFSTPKFPPIRLESARLKDFFKWLARSVQQVSMSSPGDSSSDGLAEELRKEMKNWDQALRGTPRGGPR